MRKLARLIPPAIPNGTTRLRRVFAFLPVNVNGTLVWLETYEVLEAYIEVQYLIIVDGESKTAKVGKWEYISKRLLNE